MTSTHTPAPTLVEAMQRLHDRELSAVELLKSIFDRIDATEETLNSWVEVYREEAIAQAVVADRRLAISDNPPAFLGIPIGVKDIFDIAGKQTLCSSALRTGCPVANRDSEPVHAMRRAGAVLLGKTVTQEFAAGVISTPARNPWNSERIPGGSSGGSAASVAAGTSLGALGSDTGGSVRIPASVTGTVGLKPTFGRLDLAGVFPLSGSLDTVGPIARTVADATVMYLGLAKRLNEIPGALSALASDEPSLTGVRIGVARPYFTERLQPDVATAFDAAVDHIRSLGAEIVECAWQDATAAKASAMLISRVESAVVHHDALRTTPELIGEDVRLRFEVGALLSGGVYIQARKAREAVKESIEGLFRDNTLHALIAPTLPATAPPAADPVVRYPDGSVEAVGPALTRFTMPWNATGQPVISVPCGFDTEGMPIGLSFVGRPDQELDLSKIAHVYERSAGWYRRRPVLAGSDE